LTKNIDCENINEVVLSEIIYNALELRPINSMLKFIGKNFHMGIKILVEDGVNNTAKEFL